MTKTFCDRCGDPLGVLDHCTIDREIHGEEHPEYGVPYKKTVHLDLCVFCLHCAAHLLLERLGDAEAEEFLKGLATRNKEAEAAR